MTNRFGAALGALAAVATLSLAGCDLSFGPADPTDLPAPTVSLAQAAPEVPSDGSTPSCDDVDSDLFAGYRTITETCDGTPTGNTWAGQGSARIDVPTILQVLSGASGFEETHRMGATDQGLAYVAWEDVATTCTNWCTDEDVHLAFVVVGPDITGGDTFYLVFQTATSDASDDEFRAAVEAMEVVP